MKAAIALLLTTGALVALLVGAPSKAEESSDSLLNVILVSRGEPQNVGIYSSEINSLRRVGSQAELEAALHEETRVIILDRSVLGSLSTPYLSAQLARGVQIVGLNISNKELKTLTDWNRAWQQANPGTSARQDPLTWADAPPRDLPFYTLIRMNPGRSGEAYGYLTITQDFFQLRVGRAANLDCRDGQPWSACVEIYDDGLYRLSPL